MLSYIIGTQKLCSVNIYASILQQQLSRFLWSGISFDKIDGVGSFSKILNYIYLKKKLNKITLLKSVRMFLSNIISNKTDVVGSFPKKLNDT